MLPVKMAVKGYYTALKFCQYFLINLKLFMTNAFLILNKNIWGIFFQNLAGENLPPPLPLVFLLSPFNALQTYVGTVLNMSETV